MLPADHGAGSRQEAVGGGVRWAQVPLPVPPLKHRKPNLLGRYSSTASTPAASALRPLRDPDAPEPDEDETGTD